MENKMKKLLKTLAIGLAVVFTIGCGKDEMVIVPSSQGSQRGET